MTETVTFVLSWIAGCALGAFFYGGLWWTVRKTVSSPRPAQWVLGSALVRMTVVLAGFYLVAGAHWQRWLLCLLGVVMSRPVVTWLTKHVSTGRPRVSDAT